MSKTVPLPRDKKQLYGRLRQREDLRGGQIKIVERKLCQYV
jgi:hypothetical protein